MLARSIRRFYGTTTVIFGKHAREDIMKGVVLLNKATSSTLGPKGRNVCLENELGLPRITKDGVTVAKNVSLKNKLQEIGASLFRKASGSTNLHAGDGTTTTIILAEAILTEGRRYLEYNANPIEMKRGMDKARKEIVSFLNELSIPIENKQQLFQVAMVSTNYDTAMSALISDALWEVGVNGLVEIEPGNSIQNELIYTKGVALTRGYASKDFIVNKALAKVEQEYPLVLVANLQIQSIREIVPALELAKKLKKPLFIIAEDISNDVMSNLIFNQLKGIIEICAITVPGMGSHTKNILEDMALLTGATLFDENNYGHFLNIRSLDFGKENVLGSLAMSMKPFSQAEVDGNNGLTHVLLSQTICGSMARIMVGGTTQVDIFENRDRLVDGLNAVKNAIKSGVVPGGGTCMIRAAKLLDFVEVENEEQKYGIDILKRALLIPTQTLLNNAGKNGRYVVHRIQEKQQENPNIGYDVNTDEYVDLVERGIFDSLVVSRTTIEDAVSVAGMLLTTEVAITKDFYYAAPKLNTYKKEIF